MFPISSVLSVNADPFTTLRMYWPVVASYIFHCVPVLATKVPPVSDAGRVPVVQMYGPTTPYWLITSKRVFIPHRRALVVFIDHSVSPVYKLVAIIPLEADV